jgi:hypothetical protein
MKPAQPVVPIPEIKAPPIVAYQLRQENQLHHEVRIMVRDPLSGSYRDLPWSETIVSPDGTKITMTDPSIHQDSVGIIDLTATNPQPPWYYLGPQAGTTSEPFQWAPNSDKLLFDELTPDGDQSHCRWVAKVVDLKKNIVSPIPLPPTKCSLGPADRISYQRVWWTPDGRGYFAVTSLAGKNHVFTTSEVYFYDLAGRLLKRLRIPGTLQEEQVSSTNPLSPDQHTLLGKRTTAGSPRSAVWQSRWELIDINTGRVTDLPFETKVIGAASQQSSSGIKILGWYDKKHLTGVQGSGRTQKLVICDLHGHQVRVFAVPNLDISQLDPAK